MMLQDLAKGHLRKSLGEQLQLLQEGKSDDWLRVASMQHGAEASSQGEPSPKAAKTTVQPHLDDDAKALLDYLNSNSMGGFTSPPPNASRDLSSVMQRHTRAHTHSLWGCKVQRRGLVSA